MGQIKSIESLQDGGEDYFIVEFSDTKTKNFFPVKNNVNLRMISSKEEFEIILNILKKDRKMEEISSKKDKLIYFNRSVSKNCIKEITNRICELAVVKDVTVNEQKILDKLIKTLVIEASSVLEISLKESNELITTYLKEENGKG